MPKFYILVMAKQRQRNDLFEIHLERYLHLHKRRVVELKKYVYKKICKQIENVNKNICSYGKYLC